MLCRIAHSVSLDRGHSFVLHLDDLRCVECTHYVRLLYVPVNIQCTSVYIYNVRRCTRSERLCIHCVRKYTCCACPCIDCECLCIYGVRLYTYSV